MGKVRVGVFFAYLQKASFRRFRMTSLLRKTVLLLVLGLAGCSTISRGIDRADGPEGRGTIDLTTPGTFYANSTIYRGDIQVMVHPNVNLEKPPTALFVPLGLTQAMRDSLPVSQGISYQVWQQFLQKGTFSTLELASIAPPYRVEAALPLARQMGADMLLGGYITYYLDGGQTGNTKISLQLEVYDTQSGEMLWSIAHAGLLPHQAARDFILFEVKDRMPADPMGAVIAAVAGDMAELLHMWTDPSAYEHHKRAKTPRGDSAFGRF